MLDVCAIILFRWTFVQIDLAQIRFLSKFFITEKPTTNSMVVKEFMFFTTSYIFKTKWIKILQNILNIFIWIFGQHIYIYLDTHSPTIL